jgi:hypothetical protein
VTTPPVRPTNLLEGTLFFGLCAAGSDRLEVVAIYILAVVQRNPGRQASPQPAQLMGSFSAKAKGIVELLVNRLHDLAEGRRPTLQPLGPSPFAPVSSGWADDASSVALAPPSVILFALEAHIGHVWSGSRRSRARRPGIRLAAQGKEGLGQRLVFGGSTGETGDHPGRVDGNEQAESLVPPQAVGPSDVGVAG